MGFFSKKSKKSTKNSKMEFGYWGIQGLGQPIRYLLAAAKADYKETTFMEFKDWFGEAKPNLAKETPFANLPFLKDGDRIMTQSGCILRYLGQKYGYEPKTVEGKIYVDMVHGVLVDFWDQNTKLIFNIQEFDQNKEKAHETMLGMMTQINSHLKSHGPFVAGDQLTWVDFFLYHFLAIFTRWSSKIKALSEVSGYMAAVEKAAGENMTGYFNQIVDKQPLYPPGMVHESMAVTLKDLKAAF